MLLGHQREPSYGHWTYVRRGELWTKGKRTCKLYGTRGVL